jgi:hypothetical protein
MNFRLGEPLPPGDSTLCPFFSSDGDGSEGENVIGLLRERCRQRPRSVVEPVEGICMDVGLSELRRRLRPRWDSSSVVSRWCSWVERIGDVRIAAMIGK